MDEYILYTVVWIYTIFFAKGLCKLLFSGVFIRDIEDSNPFIFIVTIELLKQFKIFLAKGKRKKIMFFMS